MKRTRARRTRVVRVTVDCLDADLGLAFCLDHKGRRYTVDRRSAVSISALAEGLKLDVVATDSGLIQGLAFDKAR
jgi:hypothetical protein